jgi:type IV secretory pathway VirB2 component (pilin)
MDGRFGQHVRSIADSAHKSLVVINNSIVRHHADDTRFALHSGMPKQVGRSESNSGQSTSTGVSRKVFVPTCSSLRRLVSAATTVARRAALVASLVLLSPRWSAAQSPWERAANNLALTFTGPLARALALVAIVIGGLLFMFGEQGAKRQISGIVFGGGLALFAAQFLAWLF